MSSNLPAQQSTERRSLFDLIRHEKTQEQIKASLPPSVSLERFTAITVSAINHNPDLIDADRQSFFTALLKCAQEGLLPDGQDSVLNVYNTNIGGRGKPDHWILKVQFQRMVGGLLKQFLRAGIPAYAESVYENDLFERWNDDHGQHLNHRPAKLGQGRGPRVGAYAVGKLPSGQIVIQVMEMEDLERARLSSKSPDKGPWKVWPERMGEKSALHRLRKRIAILDETAAKELARTDEEFEEDEEDEEEEETPVDPPKQAVPTGDEARPASLQSVVDQAAPPPAAGDPGPQEGDII